MIPLSVLDAGRDSNSSVVRGAAPQFVPDGHGPASWSQPAIARGWAPNLRQFPSCAILASMHAEVMGTCCHTAVSITRVRARRLA